MANILPATDPQCAEYAAQLLRSGELVCFPTDTVYGIGAAASNEAAIKRLYAVKGRPPNKSLPLLIANSIGAMDLADVPPIANDLMSHFWPGGLTLVFKKAEMFFSAALAGQQTVALRVPDQDLVRDIIRLLREPITGTSANRTGARPPVSAAEVAFQLGDMASLVIDDGPSPRGVESTIVDLSQDAPVLQREGAITRQEIESVLGRPLRTA
jgi:L-threonylcarbamoyladenylate synthase